MITLRKCIRCEFNGYVLVVYEPRNPKIRKVYYFYELMEI